MGVITNDNVIRKFSLWRIGSGIENRLAKAIASNDYETVEHYLQEAYVEGYHTGNKEENKDKWR